MSSQAFFWVNLVLAAVFVVFFLWGRKQKGPARLSLRDAFGKTAADQKNNNKKVPVYYKSKSTDPEDRHSKNLNVMFLYNGHNFDAYEVLGIPAGSNFTAAEKAYHQLTQGADKEKKDFLESALTAIRLSR